MKKITKHNSQNNLILKDKIKKKNQKKKRIELLNVGIGKKPKKK